MHTVDTALAACAASAPCALVVGSWPVSSHPPPHGCASGKTPATTRHAAMLLCVSPCPCAAPWRVPGGPSGFYGWPLEGRCGCQIPQRKNLGYRAWLRAEVDGPGCTDDAVIAEVGVGGWPHAPVLYQHRKLLGPDESAVPVCEGACRAGAAARSAYPSSGCLLPRLTSRLRSISTSVMLTMRCAFTWHRVCAVPNFGSQLTSPLSSVPDHRQAERHACRCKHLAASAHCLWLLRRRGAKATLIGAPLAHTSSHHAPRMTQCTLLSS